MRPDGPDHFVLFSTGRRFYASAHTIGLGPDDRIGMRAFHGGVGMLDAGGPGEDVATWTPEEREELAAYMIERWQAFARPPFDVIERVDISNLTTMFTVALDRDYDEPFTGLFGHLACVIEADRAETFVVAAIETQRPSSLHRRGEIVGLVRRL
jgi:hypothetical protein